jgi:Flp pilus assembly protein TadD
MNSADLFTSAISSVADETDATHRYNFLHSTMRSVLQWAALSSVEGATALSPVVAETRLTEIAHQLLMPVDGALAPAIDYALTQLSIQGITEPLDRWLAGGERSAARCAQAWVPYRNESLGHGVISTEEVERGTPLLVEWLAAVIDGCAPVLPELLNGQTILRLVERTSQRTHVVEVSTLRTYNENPVVIRRIRKRGDAWLVQAQELASDVAPTMTYPVAPGSVLLMAVGRDVVRFRPRQIPGSASSTLVLLPERQTDVFTGRSTELDLVKTWIGDLESRVCNVYGEGGIGKTTLVLEALHRLLEDGYGADGGGPIDLICFYSSKLTRYGPEGLERIAGITPSIADAAREVARSYYELLDRDWFSGEPKALIERSGQLLRELGIARDRVLVILDNTETLLSSSSDRDALAAAVDLMARKVGRVLITSRNRERVEAKPIALGPLAETEAEQLLLRLAEEEGAAALLQTGTSGRRRIVNKFKGKPLLIEVFARMVARDKLSLQRAEERVLQRAESDLGLFLYEDAWERFNDVQRKVMLALAKVDTVIPSSGIGIACAALGCSQLEMAETLEENRFAQMQDYGGSYDIVFDSIATAFLRSKLDGLSEAEGAEVNSATAKVQKGIREMSMSALAGTDPGFMPQEGSQGALSDAARAALVAARHGDLQEARQLFEEAVELEPSNASLRHRYAFFLTRHMGDLSAASREASKACELDPTDAQAWFTLANILARQGGVSTVDDAIVRAQALGFAEVHRCTLLQARARVMAISSRHPRSSIYEQEAKQFLEASRLKRTRTPLDEKHMDEVDKVSDWLDDVLSARR